MPAQLLSPLGALAAASVLVLITLVFDIVALLRRRRQRGVDPLPRSLNHATDLLYVLVPQTIAAALVVVLPMTSSPAANTVLGYLFVASVLYFVGLSAGLALYNRAATRQLGSAAPVEAPPLILPPPSASQTYELSNGAEAGDLVWRLLYVALGFFTAIDLAPWGVATFGNSPLSAVGNVIGVFLLVIGGIGLSVFLIGVLTLFPRNRFRADAAGLRYRIGLLRRRAISWRDVRRFLVRAHRDGRFSFQLILASGRAVVFWDRSPAAALSPARMTRSPRRPMPVTARELAAIILDRTGLRPEVLSPQQTEARIRESIDAYAHQVAQRAERLAQ